MRDCAQFFVSSYFVCIVDMCIYVDMWECLCVCVVWCGEVQRLMRILYYSLWTHIIEPIHSVKDKQLQWTANISQRRKHHNLEEELKKANIINLSVKVSWVKRIRCDEQRDTTTTTKTLATFKLCCLDCVRFFSGSWSARIDTFRQKT